MSWEEPLQWITTTQDGKLLVVEETAALVAEINQPLTVVAVAGFFRTGKSYLMNRLAGKPSGFALGSTLESVTEGMWIWCIPHPMKSNETLVLIDTEGLDDPLKVSEQHDMDIFSLAVLLSSTFIFNAIGKIDQFMIDKLYFVTELTKRIKVKSSSVAADEESTFTEFTEYFPNFVLAVRDFPLELKLNDQEVTADEYFNHVLALTKRKSKSIRAYNRPQEAIRNAFKSHNCFVFTRPVEDEKLFPRLAKNDIPDSQLSTAFLQQSKEFNTFILSVSSVKKLKQGIPVNGQRKFFVDENVRGIVPQFLEQSYGSSGNGGQQFQIYLLESRNLLKGNPCEFRMTKHCPPLNRTRRQKKLHQGNLNIVSFLRGLPRKQYDPMSFYIDVVHVSSSLITFSCNGIFKEVFQTVAEEYVKAINSGADLCIESIVALVTERENNRIVEKSLELYKDEMETLLLPTTAQTFNNVHNRAYKKALDFFRGNCVLDDTGKFFDIVVVLLRDFYARKLDENESTSVTKCSDLIKQLFESSIAKKLEQGQYACIGGYKVYCEDIEGFLRLYEDIPEKGVKADEVCVNFLRNRTERYLIMAADSELSEKEKQIEVAKLEKKLAELEARAKDEELTMEKERWKKLQNDHQMQVVQMQNEYQRQEVERKIKLIELTKNLAEQERLMTESLRAAEMNEEINSLRRQSEPNAFESFLGATRSVANTIWNVMPIAIAGRRSLPPSAVKLKRKLQSMYKKCVVPRVHSSEYTLSMDEYYVELEISSADGETTHSIQLEEIFEKYEDEIPTRILVESQPGYGKTTLATKLIFDWANEKKYLKRFDLAFFIPLRQMEGKGLKEQIEKICLNLECGMDLDHYRRNKMLLVLDGFDEIGPISRRDIMLSQFEFTEMTVVVTSRPGIFPMTSKEFHVGKRRLDINFKKVTIRGIEDRKKFLTKLCTPHEIASLPEKVENVFSSPLLLLLISEFINRHVTIDTTKSSITITDLYKSLLSNLVKRSLAREEKLVSVQVDLFNVKDKTSRNWQEMVEKFGDLCLIKLRNNVFTFESDKFIEEIYELGLLTKHNYVTTFKMMEHFECFHLSFMEFCIAYSVWRKFKTGQIGDNTNTHSHKELFEQMSYILKVTVETDCLLGLFLSGLLQEQTMQLFDQLESAGFKFGVEKSSIIFWKMIAQLNGIANVELAKSIAEFIYWKIDPMDDDLLNYFLKYQFHSDLIGNVIVMGKMKTIRLPAMMACNLPVPVRVKVDNLELSLENGKMRKDELVNYLKQIERCQELHCVIESCDFEDDFFLEEMFSLFLSIIANEKKNLEMMECAPASVYPVFLHSINNGVLHETKFRDLRVHLSSDEYSVDDKIDIICCLLEMNRIYNLQLSIQDEIGDDDLRRILDCGLQSESLRELYVENRNEKSIKLDWHKFGKKEWNSFTLINCIWYCGQLAPSVPCADCSCKRVIDGMNDGFCYNYHNANFNSNASCDWLNDKPIIILQLY